MTAVLKHELRAYFHSLTAYVFGAFLLAFVGIGAMMYNLQAAVSNFEYVLSFGCLVFVVIVPILTMRVIAEERKQKTDQLLYSLPITTTQVVIGKYLALLTVYLIPLCIICIYPLIFSQFGDIFGGHFSGGGFRSSSSGGRRVNRGSDIRIKVRLTLAEIANGVTKKLKINKTVACDKCGGSGARDANSYSTCSTCNGTGYVMRVENTFFGRMQTQGVCPTCGGTGKVITAPCDKCKGEGTLRGQEVVEIRIPAGVGEGMVLTVTGKGNAARHGGVNGDLQVMIEEESNPELVRDGNDLIHNLNITVTTALLGGTVEVPTVDGRAKIKIAPGTHAGKVLRLGGKGLPDVNGYGRGDELVVVDITVPSKLSAEERKLVEQLAAQPSFQKAESVKNQNIFERMKSFFR